METEKWESSEPPKQKVSGKPQALETTEMGHAAVNRSAADETQLQPFSLP